MSVADRSLGSRRSGVLRVVHLVSGLMYGGGQKVALDLMAGLSTSEATKETELWLLGSRHDSFSAHANVVVQYDGNYASPLTLLSSAQALRSHLKAKRVDIIHSHGWDADMIAYLATVGRHESRVVHLHVTPNWILSNSPKHQARRLATDLVFSGAQTRIVCVAEAVRNHWTPVFRRLSTRAIVIHNAADCQRFFPVARATEPNLVLGVACRLSAQKGLDVLIQALPEILRLAPQVRLKIAGEGSEHSALERLASDLNAAHAIEFLGHIDDIEHFFRSIDIFVLPAVSDEGLPLAILEAMATGLPIVTTDVGGACEAVRHGVDGFVIPPRSQSKLIQAVVELADNPELRAFMGQSAAARARAAFSPEAQLNAIRATYAGLVDCEKTSLRRGPQAGSPSAARS